MLPRIRFSTAFLVLCLFALFAPIAFAAGTMTLTLQPHCTETDRTKCTEFAVADAQHLTTNTLNVGDILDLDVVVKGSDFAKVRYVRAWLDYDPEVLEARSIEMTSALPSPIPGEQTVDRVGKVVKIGGMTDQGLSGDNVAIARVTFRVLRNTSDTVVGFREYHPDGLGSAYVNGASATGAPEPLLSSEPTKLTVKLSAAAGSSSAPASSASSSLSSVSSASSVSSSSSSSPASSSFSLLQVQNVKVTTRDTMIFLGWQALKSAELAGYNVYYSTVSGRYIQRRSVSPTSTSLVLRDLEPGATYYLAVRAVNAQDQESVFSQEVSVTVGKPETASSPLSNIPSDLTPPDRNPAQNGKVVQGETGTTSMILLIVVGSAALGTALAFRRQMKINSASPL